MKLKRFLGRTFLLAVLLSCGDPAIARAQLTGAFADGITVDTEYLTGATQATDIAFAADGRAVVTLKAGQVVIRRTDGTRNMLSGLFGTVDMGSEKGLLGVVAHPDVATNNTFFFYVSNGTDANDKHRVYSGVLNAMDELTIDMANPIIAASEGNGPGLRGPANHDGGGLFIHNRQLYIGVGDTGANMTPPTNKFSSCLNLGNGKILRVNLDGTVPMDNPLANEAMVTSCDSATGMWSMAAPDRRVYAWGFRNPWRFWIDPGTGLMWIGDVGETTREEISVGSGNQHYGYPFREGTENYEGDSGRGADGSLQNTHCMTMSPARECTGPVYDYARTQQTNCVIGGLIPSGCGWDNAFGGSTYYLFADHGAGWIRALTVSADRRGIMGTTAMDFGTFQGAQPRSFRMGPDDSMYLVVNSGVYRFTPNDRTGDDCMGGMGGMGGMAGMGGSGGGASGSGGNGGSATGGASSGGSSGSATGGNGGTNATGGSAVTGGMGVTGGAGNAGGAGGAAGAGTAGGGGSDDDDGGCGCRTTGQAARPFALALLGLALALALGRRRNRR